jgi:glutathione synthase/RimK-type ligase-like ATP-grasp enzyme
MRYRILPYRQGSKSAKALADKLGGKVLKLEGSKYKYSSGDVIINWGNTTTPDHLEGQMPGSHWFNFPWEIRSASNKLLFFQRMKEAGLSDIIPRFFTSQDEIPDDAFPIVCRTVLAGHSGDGIVIANTRSDLVPAPLYVQYVKKQDEYRIHVGMRGENTGYPYSEDGDVPFADIISVQRKARRLETPDSEVNWKVRNHQNGFVYVRQNVAPPDAVLEVAKQAFVASGLDFGAIDVIWNQQQQRAYVLELNSAPGLEGSTVDDYAKFFRGE